MSYFKRTQIHVVRVKPNERRGKVFHGNLLSNALKRGSFLKES